MSKEKRWIIVSDGTAQTMYVGKTELAEPDVQNDVMLGRAIELTECRALRTLLLPAPNGGIAQKEMISPIGLARTGIRFTVKPSAYFWPDEDELTQKTFMEALKPVEEAEIQHRAAAANLVIPGATRIGPGGKLVQ